ncbi:MAG: AmmeMemoRadiSam system protein A [Deltaproteobacteria bacterium]|nr:AmmeMemoRadiSam system protein A [Deltaproteobacteria bacterium]
MTPLTLTECEELLEIARRSIATLLEYGERAVLDGVSEGLNRAGGAFVSLHRRNPAPGQTRLRGCIGIFEADAPLADTVSRMAAAAATQDPRFSPVEAEELAELEIEISVLSPRQRAQAEEVEVGRHGVYITQGVHRGVLLPQVATEAGWEREEFLAGTCRKAGLPADAWRAATTTIEIFSAQVFGEAE